MDERMFDLLTKMYSEMQRRFNQVDNRLDHVDSRLDQIDNRLDHMDSRLDQADKRFEQIDKRFESLEAKVDKNTILLENMNDKIKIIAEVQQNHFEMNERQHQNMMKEYNEQYSLLKLVLNYTIPDNRRA